MFSIDWLMLYITFESSTRTTSQGQNELDSKILPASQLQTLHFEIAETASRVTDAQPNVVDVATLNTEIKINIEDQCHQGSINLLLVNQDEPGISLRLGLR